METANAKSFLLKGGEWLTNESDPQSMFSPEKFSEEQLMIKDLCIQFLNTEIWPILNRIDKLESGLMPSLLKKAGDQGLLATSFPEDLGGLGKDFITSTIISEYLGAGHSFSVAISAHMGIGTLPILYFGNDLQKQKYIPKLITGEWLGSYGLTEPNSGSDALSAKTSARLSEDGKHYLLNGQKCWITNGGFADVYTVFAKIDGDKFTAFIVEKDFPGFTHGPEEDKMGIKGSSTVQLYFQDCRVPVENVLGEIGKGHKIAFNILNIGRLKLCAAALGGAKKAMADATAYAITREQFRQPIANFGAIQYKLAEMAIRCFAVESALYRSASLVNDREQQLLNLGSPFNEALLAGAEEYAIECAILKVAGSEALNYVVDENVQIHGGNGFSAEYNASRAYRDSRINRIFEGTNEINRLLTVDMTFKRALQGKLNLIPAALKVSQELMSIPESFQDGGGPFREQQRYISNFKKAILLVAGAASQRLGLALEKEQEIIMNIADMAIDTFLSESVLLRAQANKENGLFDDLQEDILNTFILDASDRILKNGKDAVSSFSEGDELRMILMGIRRFTKIEPYNIKNARRRIAAKVLEKGGYPY